jgi:stage II sporulation protein D
MARRLARLIPLLLALAAHAQMIRVRTARDGIIRVSMEDYVAWVLAGEAGGINEDAALDAIAIAARSYARAHLARHKAEGFDFCETTHCQDARPGAETPKLRAAVERTANQLLWRGANLVAGFHHRHCGGHTATPREVWSGEDNYGLVSIEDPFCASAPGASWRAVLELPHQDLQIASRTASGRVAALRDGPRLIDAEAFHLFIGRTLGWNLLRSRLYDLRRAGARYTAHGRGQGHGVGLCQTGAEARARAGHSTDAILHAYFGDVTPGLTPQHRRWTQTRTSRLDIRTAGAAFDGQLPAAAETALAQAEQLSGLRASRRLGVTAYPTLDLYRDLTGAPGFLAATTRGAAIRLQPIAILARGNRLESTLRHEFLHALIALNAARPLPEWFTEGLALWLEHPGATAAPLSPQTESTLQNPPNEQALRRAYANACAAVAGLVRMHGRARVLASLRLGLP